MRRNCIQRRRDANSMLKNHVSVLAMFDIYGSATRMSRFRHELLDLVYFFFHSRKLPLFQVLLGMASDRVMFYITIQRLRNEKNTQLDEAFVFPSRHALPLLATTLSNPFSNTQNTYRQTIRVLLILLSWAFFSLVLFSTLFLPF